MNDAFQDGPSLADFLPDTSQGYKAVAGSVNPSMAGKADKDAIIKKLETIQDPEIPVNIYELGLIYDIIIHEGGDADITMSLTALVVLSQVKCHNKSPMLLPALQKMVKAR